MLPELSDDQAMLVEQVESFVKGEIASQAASEKHEEIAHLLLPKLGEQGLLGCRLPEEVGGPELDPVVLCRCLSIIARANASLATMTAILNGMVLEYLLHFDQTPQFEERVANLITGEQSAAWANPDLSPHTDIKPSIIAQSEGENWVLDGEARYVTMGTTAHHLLLFASTPQGQRLTFWIDTNQPGIERQIVRGKLGLRDSDVAHLWFNGVHATPNDLIRSVEENDTAEQRIWSCGQLSIAAVCLGVGQMAHVTACDYAQQRKQFGKSLAQFQAIQWKIADTGMELEAGQLLIDKAATLWQQQDWDALQTWSQAAFVYNANAAIHTAEEALQIHGGYGFTTEFPVERFYRDAQTLKARWSTGQQAIDTIASGQWYQQV